MARIAPRTRGSDAGAPAERPARSEEEIDEALRDSFPASDPPPWTLGTTADDDR